MTRHATRSYKSFPRIQNFDLTVLKKQVSWFTDRLVNPHKVTNTKVCNRNGPNCIDPISKLFSRVARLKNPQTRTRTITTKRPSPKRKPLSNPLRNRKRNKIRNHPKTTFWTLSTFLTRTTLPASLKTT